MTSRRECYNTLDDPTVMKICNLIIFGILILSTTPVRAFDMSERSEKSVVAIGYPTKNGIKYGTGVLIKTDRFVLVTAKHVVMDNEGNQFSDIYFWGNKIGGGSFRRTFPEMTQKWPNIKWVAHQNPDIDLAATVVGIAELSDDVGFLTLSDFKSRSLIKKGDDIYYLGFPSFFGAKYGSNPFLRKGVVGLQEKSENIFYIDATVAPGNSGGPVFSIKKGEPEFLGIVSAFEPFERDGHLFHTGIGIVYPVDHIQELIESKYFRDKTY